MSEFTTVSDATGYPLDLPNSLERNLQSYSIAGNTIDSKTQTPLAPIGITGVGDKVNRNLFNNKFLRSTQFSIAYGTQGSSASSISTGIRVSGGNSNSSISIIILEVEKVKGMTFTFSAEVQAYNGATGLFCVNYCDYYGNNMIGVPGTSEIYIYGSDGLKQISMTFTVTSEPASTQKYIIFKPYSNASGTTLTGDIYADFNNLQLELGSVKTSYAGYSGPNIPVIDYDNVIGYGLNSYVGKTPNEIISGGGEVYRIPIIQTNNNLCIYPAFYSIPWGSNYPQIVQLLNSLGIGSYKISCKSVMNSFTKALVSGLRTGFETQVMDNGVSTWISFLLNVPITVQVGDVFGLELNVNVTTSNIGKFVKFYMYGLGSNAVGSYGIVDFVDFQIKESNIATSYTPYEREVESCIYTDRPLFKNDIYDLLSSDGKLYRKLGYKVFDNNSNWIIEGSINFYVNDIITDAVKSSNVICSSQKSDKSLGITVENCYVNGTGRFNFATSSITHTVDAMKTYAGSNPISIIYQLSTPVEEDYVLPYIKCDSKYSIFSTETKVPPYYMTANYITGESGDKNRLTLIKNIYNKLNSQTKKTSGYPLVMHDCLNRGFQSLKIKGNITQSNITPTPNSLNNTGYVGDRIVENLFNNKNLYSLTSRTQLGDSSTDTGFTVTGVSSGTFTRYYHLFMGDDVKGKSFRFTCSLNATDISGNIGIVFQRLDGSYSLISGATSPISFSSGSSQNIDISCTVPTTLISTPVNQSQFRLVIRLYVTTTATSILALSNVMLNEGTTALPYTKYIGSYFPVADCANTIQYGLQSYVGKTPTQVISEGNKIYRLPLNIKSKNLFDKDNFYFGSTYALTEITYENYIYTCRGTNTGGAEYAWSRGELPFHLKTILLKGVRRTLSIKVKILEKSTQTSLAIQIFGGSSINNNTEGINSVVNVGVINEWIRVSLTSNGNYDINSLCIRVNSHKIAIDFSSLQIEEGLATTAYENYNNINPKYLYLNKPLYKIDDTLVETLDFNKTSQSSFIERYEITGNETVEKLWSTSSVFGLTMLSNRVAFSDLTKVALICSHYPTTFYDGGTGSIYNYRENSSYPYLAAFNYKTTSNWDLVIKDTNFTDATLLITYFAQQYANGTPVTIYWVRQETVDNYISPSLKSGRKTNIMRLGDVASSKIEATYI
jgi:hypothetical protein